MHGCHGQRRFILLFLFPVLAAGCNDAAGTPEESSPPPTIETGRDFDSTTAGTIRGQVTWSGELPEVPLIRDHVHRFEESRGQSIVRENPNAPVVDPKTRGVGSAVIYLRGLDPRRGRPWDHPSVRVEQRDYRLHVVQGGADSRVGFVRRGEAMEMVSTQPVFHSLRAGGAAFFTLAFPDPDQPLSRRLEKKGVVELSSAANYYWMRAYVFVDDHPYYARTDAEGWFTLTQVPPGKYQMVCWMPNWHRERHERHPDTALVVRWFFRPPAEVVQPITVGSGEARDVQFTVGSASFSDALQKRAD